MTNDCPGCGAALQARRAPGAQVASGPVTAMVEAHDVLVCPKGCPTPAKDLSTLLTRTLSRALLFSTGDARTVRCGDCGAVLDLPMRATTRAVTVEPDGLSPFTLTFAVPVARCGECGLDNIPAALTQDVERSMFGACGLAAAERPTRRFRLRRRRGGQGSRGGP